MPPHWRQINARMLDAPQLAPMMAAGRQPRQGDLWGVRPGIRHLQNFSGSSIFALLANDPDFEYLIVDLHHRTGPPACGWRKNIHSVR